MRYFHKYASTGLMWETIFVLINITILRHCEGWKGCDKWNDQWELRHIRKPSKKQSDGTFALTLVTISNNSLSLWSRS